MPTDRYYTILNEYERRLNERVKNGEIKETTRDTYLQDANRVFEALVGVFPQEVVKAIVALRFEGPYTHVIAELKAIADERQGRRTK